MDSWTVTFSSQRRDDDSVHVTVMVVQAHSQLAAEDIVMRKCRLIGYKNYQVSAKKT